MGNIYVDYDKVSMILTIKCFKDDILKDTKKIEMSEDYITSSKSTENGVTKDVDIYGFVIEERSVLESDMSIINDINDFDLRAILKKIILVKNENEREIIKSLLPNHYCLLIDNIDQEIRDAITIYNNI